MSRLSKDPYHQLCQLSKEIAILSSTNGLLEWDQETYMPQSAIALRTEQLELIASLIHQRKISSKFSKTLEKLIDLESGEVLVDALSDVQLATLREWRRNYLQAVKLPTSFVRKFSKMTSEALHQWPIAKSNNDFAAFAPHLEKVVSLCRQKADILGFQEHPYDALLDLFEPGMKTSYLTPLFGRLKIALTSLVKRIGTCPPVENRFLYGHFPAHTQLHFVHQLLEAMGFDRKTSRLDQSSHPFCVGFHPDETRMTTKVHPEYLMSNIFSVIHEGGHGLYNMGLPKELFGTPLCEHSSLGIDESQSRLWETRIGRSFPFWEHFYPLLQKQFPEQLGGIYLNEFYRAINIVKPTFIRTESDEVTYSLHIMIRFEIEKALIEGSLKVKDIPEVWNEKMREYLGITPRTNTEGCLQDIHWAMGGIGYFPTYTLGNLYASQFFLKFEQDHPDWKEQVQKGHFFFIREWLKDKIHRHGRQYPPEELVIRITGKPLNEKPFIDYLENKYQSLYHIKS